MSNFNLQTFLVGYGDQKASNNPQIRNFDLSYKLLGQKCTQPQSNEYVIAPGQTLSAINGTRTTSLSNSSAFNVTVPVANVNTYRFTWNGTGTNPAFRTDRALGVDNTSIFNITINGPLVTYTNAGGTLMSTASVQVGDIIYIGPNSGFQPSNQGTFTIVSFTSNSISIQNINAVIETGTLINTPSDFDAFSAGGASNQVQIGDNIVISAGFSPATFGTYPVTNVTPTWFEVSVGNPLGIPLQTGIVPTISGMIFYSSCKRFVFIASQGNLVVQVNADTSTNTVIQPWELNNPSLPGIYMKHGTCYSLVLVNNGLIPVDCVVVTVE
jgi:hypothetical protein